MLTFRSSSPAAIHALSTVHVRPPRTPVVLIWLNLYLLTSHAHPPQFVSSRIPRPLHRTCAPGRPAVLIWRSGKHTGSCCQPKHGLLQHAVAAKAPGWVLKKEQQKDDQLISDYISPFSIEREGREQASPFFLLLFFFARACALVTGTAEPDSHAVSSSSDFTERVGVLDLLIVLGACCMRTCQYRNATYAVKTVSVAPLYAVK